MKPFQTPKFYKTPTWTKILLLFLIISLVVGKFEPKFINSTPIIQHSQSIESTSTHSSCYTTVDPIIINNASDWANYPFIIGAGMPGDPYIIEGIEVVGNEPYYESEPEYYGIKISDNNASMIIRDCYIHHFHTGIFFGPLNDTIPQRIERNIIEYCGVGIFVFGANVTISNNRISECHASETNLYKNLHTFGQDFAIYGGVGIYVFIGIGVIITSNIISTCDIGAAFYSFSTIKHNQFIGCGIYFAPSHLYQFNLENNSVNGLPLGYYTPINFNQTEGEPLIFDGTIQQYGQLIVAGLDNIVVKNMNIRDTTLGYLLNNNNNLTVSKCTADGCLFGMYIFGSAPLDGSIEFVDVSEIRIKNCYIGLNIGMRFTDYEGTNLTVSIGISEFTNNQIDILMGYYKSSPFSMSVPNGSTMYLDAYWNYRVQVTYNGSILNSTDSQLHYQVSIYSTPEYEHNATIVHLNHIGQYHILHEVLYKPDKPDTYWNVTINVFEIPIEKKSLGAYMGLWLSSSLGITMVCIMIFAKKRRSML